MLQKVLVLEENYFVGLRVVVVLGQVYVDSRPMVGLSNAAFKYGTIHFFESLFEVCDLFLLQFLTLKYFLKFPLPVAILGDDHGLNDLHHFERIYSLESFFLTVVCE